MKIILTASTLILTLIIHAQTDIIEFRSHSGNINSFTKYSTKCSADGIYTNFGEAPRPWVESAVLDSVIFLSDSTAIMVTSTLCRYTEFDRSPKEEKVPRKELGELWQAGSDTLANHPLFSKRHSLDSIKIILDRDYNFRNSTDETIFIGFDNENLKKRAARKKLHKLRKSNRKQNRNGFSFLFLLLIPVLTVYIVSPYLFKASGRK